MNLVRKRERERKARPDGDFLLPCSGAVHDQRGRDEQLPNSLLVKIILA